MTGNETSNEILHRKFTGEIYEVGFIYDAEHLGLGVGCGMRRINTVRIPPAGFTSPQLS